MAKSIMIQGTTSNAGKSLIAAGLCRVLAQDGYRVAPFKSQNMALNSFITKDGLEMGRAQVVQAEAAGIEPDIRMNPILLKPTSDKGSQVIVNGEVLENMTAREYYKNKEKLVPQIQKAYHSLAGEFDIIVLEGAGSPAEINLKEQDIVNMGMAKLSNSPVLIAGDIDRGGVFASLAGTMLLFDEEEKKRVKGMIINKFRGDITILEPGLKMLEQIAKVPVCGVIPYLQVDIDDEDSLAECIERKAVPNVIDIAVIRLPRISNFTDFNPFEYMGGVSLRYISALKELGEPDMILLPGTKNTIGDLKWLRSSGLEAAILKRAGRGVPVFGICGGYQMLGRSIRDESGVEGGGEIKGMGLLDGSTIFRAKKTRKRVCGELNTVGGIFANISKKAYDGYEIHMGDNGQNRMVEQKGNIYGTYLHGIFDAEEINGEILSALLKEKGIDERDFCSVDIRAYKQQQYDLLADAVRESLDMDYIYRVIERGV